ncbi:MAG: hypothetical protein JJV97_03680 [SAR324 cluster bacterium]|nr:hypothetical protein [SAR324 cluster bacterium]
MSPYPFYTFFHLLGLFILLLSLGGMIILSLAGDELKKKYRKILISGHGIGLITMLVTGFGMLARLGDIYAWAWWKVAIWVVIGIIPSLMLRNRKFVWPGAIILLLLISCSVLLVMYKPI